MVVVVVRGGAPEMHRNASARQRRRRRVPARWPYAAVYAPRQGWRDVPWHDVPRRAVSTPWMAAAGAPPPPPAVPPSCITCLMDWMLR